MKWIKRMMRRKKQILIVEDETDTALLVRHFLESRGFETVWARDGAVAIQLARKSFPDLIVLDIMMPEVDGITALETLKKDGSTGDIPVVMCTVLTRTNEVERCFQAGAEGYILKPMDMRRLLRKINALLDLPFPETVESYS